MSFYPPKINARFLISGNAGDVLRANAAGRSASFVCGAVAQISLRVADETVCEAKFKAAGCGFLFAAADVLCEKIVGKSINQGLNVIELIEDELGEFETSRTHCAALVWQTWQAAVNNFRAAEVTDWNGDEALICTCFGVSEKTIENVVAENLLTTVEQVTDICNAGGGCGSCQPLIEEIIADVWRG